MIWIVIILILALAILGAFGISWIMEKIKKLNPFSNGD